MLGCGTGNLGTHDAAAIRAMLTKWRSRSWPISSQETLSRRLRVRRLTGPCVEMPTFLARQEAYE
jgi:hypothetical protein